MDNVLTLCINGKKYECRVIDVQAGQLVLEASYYDYDGAFITQTLTITTIPQDIVKYSPI